MISLAVAQVDTVHAMAGRPAKRRHCRPSSTSSQPELSGTVIGIWYSTLHSLQSFYLVSHEASCRVIGRHYANARRDVMAGDLGRCLMRRACSENGHQTRVMDVSLPDGNTMHTYATEAPNAHQTASSLGAAAPPMVLVPGYGAGAGFFFKNLPALGGLEQVYAVTSWAQASSAARHSLRGTQRRRRTSSCSQLSDWYHAMGLKQMVSSCCAIDDRQQRQQQQQDHTIGHSHNRLIAH